MNRRVLDQIKSGTDPRTIAAGWQSEVAGFRVQRAKSLLQMNRRYKAFQTILSFFSLTSLRSVSGTVPMVLSWRFVSPLRSCQ